MAKKTTSSNTSPKISPQGLLLYKQLMDNTTFIKRQQWATTNYAALIYAGTIFLHDKKPDLSWALSYAALLAGVAATLLLLFFQRELGKLRKHIEKVDNYSYGGEERRAFEITTIDKDPYTRGWQILLTLISVCLVGAFLVFRALNPN